VKPWQKKIQNFFDQKFLKSQAASLAATVVDFSVLFVLTEHFHIFYVISVALGAFFGALTNFTLGRFWSFQATKAKPGPQFTRYAIVSGGSLLLNVVLVYGFTETFGIHYGFSKVVVALLVGIFFNYPLQRYFVFKVAKTG
jgi:putative flippase GtrA